MRQLILASLHLMCHLSPLVLIMILWSFLPNYLLVSSESLAMIQHVVSSATFFIGCLEFILESSLPLAGFDVCHPGHLIYLFVSIVRSYT